MTKEQHDEVIKIRKRLEVLQDEIDNEDKDELNDEQKDQSNSFSEILGNAIDTLDDFSDEFEDLS